MTEMERFFDSAMLLVISEALTAADVTACQQASACVHKGLPQDRWRQLGNMFELEAALEHLTDHPSVSDSACSRKARLDWAVSSLGLMLRMSR